MGELLGGQILGKIWVMYLLVENLEVIDNLSNIVLGELSYVKKGSHMAI